MKRLTIAMMLWALGLNAYASKPWVSSIDDLEITPVQVSFNEDVRHDIGVSEHWGIKLGMTKQEFLKRFPHAINRSNDEVYVKPDFIWLDEYEVYDKRFTAAGVSRIIVRFDQDLGDIAVFMRIQVPRLELYRVVFEDKRFNKIRSNSVDYTYLTKYGSFFFELYPQLTHEQQSQLIANREIQKIKQKMKLKKAAGVE